MSHLFRAAVFFVIALLASFVVVAQRESPDAAPKAADADEAVSNDVVERVKQLEALVEAMRAEIESLKKSARPEEAPPLVPAEAAPRVPDKDVSDPSVPSAAPANDPGKEDLSFDAGDLRVTPYGIIFFNAFSNSGGTNNADDPLWATPGGASNLSASARQSRFGLRVEGGKLGNANVKAVVEGDFYGGFPGVGVGENMGVVRLRLAHVRFDWERTSLVVGQDWMVFAPNSPTSLAAQAIPQFAAAGNPWSRLPQVRVEQKLGKKLLWQGAVLAPGTGDFPAGGATPALLQPGSGASSRLPFFQSRLSFAEGNWFGTGKTGTIGIAGHLGRSRISNGFVTEDVDSYGVALDWKFPLFKRVTAAGEAFVGKNLGGFQAGIFQGYNADFGSAQAASLGGPGGIRGIRTTGGWIQLGWNLPVFQDRLSMYGSFGLDDPRNSDLRTIGNRNFRARNLGMAYDLIYVINPRFSVGGEFRRLETTYFRGNRESSNHLNFGAKYSF